MAGVWFWVGIVPWVAILAYLVLGVRLPRPLRRGAGDGGPEQGWPRVSVVVPARNEGRNLPTLLASLSASDYPDFEIVVVDDRSTDDTREVVRLAPPGNARALTLVEGRELPDGWLGKPWACHQGAEAACGELLLFTDADTRHGPGLLRRAVDALHEDRADLLTVAGQQLMLSFWERLIQPQVFTAMLVRYRDQRLPLPPERWRSAIANGQFILVTRAAYASEGGHEALRGEVVEDLRMAQRWVRAGRRVSVRMGEDDFATRMYSSLSEITEGWSKNIVLGGAATLPPGWLRRWMAPLSMASAVALWITPPVALTAALATGAGGAWTAWAGAATGLSVLTWTLVSVRMGVPPLYGVLYPLGSAASLRILFRSWRRGREVEWKGRRYRVEGPQAEP